MARQDAYDAYKDAQGDPQFAHSCVLFWDVLGVRAMATDDHRLAVLRALRAALEKARERAGTEDPVFTHASAWFTDNVVVGTPMVKWQDLEQVLGFTQINVAYMQLLMLDAGFLARGGIAFGEHYMDDTFVFGPALVEAVDLEKKTKWPRVALSPDAADINRVVVRKFYGHPNESPQASELVCDEHDNVFVDHLGVWLGEEDDPRLFGHYLPRYKSIIETALRTHQQGDVFDKWKWLADVHNHSMSTSPYLQDATPYLIDAGPSLYRFKSFASTVP